MWGSTLDRSALTVSHGRAHTFKLTIAAGGAASTILLGAVRKPCHLLDAMVDADCVRVEAD